MFITDKGKEFLKEVPSFMMTEDHSYEEEPEDINSANAVAADPVLLDMLKDLRKKVAKQKGVPPFVVFQDPFTRRYGSQISYNHSRTYQCTRYRGKVKLRSLEQSL